MRDRIRQKAIERGVIKAEQAARMSDREIFNLIFLPGFSTAEKVTNVSGRGVGMDVVKTNVEKIGGTVDVQSTRGQGTTVRVKIPLTLAIIPALIVTCGGERYAIPQVSLLELVRLEGEAVQHGYRAWSMARQSTACGEDCCRWCISVANSNLETDESGKRGTVRPSTLLCCRPTNASSAWWSTQINDTEEIVVKPLRKQLKSVKTFAGSSIMGDGRVALILDVLGLAQRASVIAETHDKSDGRQGRGVLGERRRQTNVSICSRDPETREWLFRSPLWRGWKSFR